MKQLLEDVDVLLTSTSWEIFVTSDQFILVMWSFSKEHPYVNGSMQEINVLLFHSSSWIRLTFGQLI